MLPTNPASSAGKLKIPADEGENIIRRFAGTIKFPTVSAPGEFSLSPFHDMRNYSMSVWGEVFSSLEMELHGGASILLRWEGDTSLSLKPVMLAAHQDVVPTGDNGDWSHDPFGGEVSGGRIWGRGTIDYKCGYAGMLEAVSVLLSRGFSPSRPVLFSFGHDEEVGGLAGAQAITESLGARGIVCSSVLDEGGYIYSDPNGGVTAEIAIAEKGYASFRLVAEAVQCHSSVPPDKTAIGTLSRGIVALEEAVISLPDVPSELSASRWFNTTIAPTILSGGCKENILPGTAEVVINTRPSPGSSVAEVFDFIRSTVFPLGITVELLDNASVSEPSSVSSVQTMDYRALKTSVLHNVDTGTGFRSGVFPAATDSRRYSKIAENTYRFLPVHLGNRGIGALHSVDESISVQDYLRCVEFYVEYISRVSRKS